jgi:hypothetical protein
MQFLKKHYEKILLGTVLAGLLGVLVFMLFYIAADKQEMEQQAETLINPRVNPLPDLNLSTNNAVLGRLQTPFALDFETGNKVFNPFEWQKTPDGQMVKKASLGVQRAVVTQITPLNLVISLDQVLTNELGVRYVIGVERQAAQNYSQRRLQHRYISVGDKGNDIFALVDVKGAPENPDALRLKLEDSGDTISISKGKPFTRADGYMADISYAPEKKVFRGKRTGDKISFGGTDYMVVGVNADEVVLADQSNQKKTSLPFTP